jgi:hypothetical protein
VVAALPARAVFDALHVSVRDYPGAPAFPPSCCLVFDVIAAVVLAFLSSGREVCCISFESHGPLMIR